MIFSTRAHVKTSLVSQPSTSNPSRKIAPGLYSEAYYFKPERVDSFQVKWPKAKRSKKTNLYLDEDPPSNLTDYS